MPTKSTKYLPVLLLFFLVFVSYYTTYANLARAEPSGNLKCYRTGTLERTCCEDHIINRSPSNPAGTLVTYCTDCEVGPGGVTQNCGERYIQMFEVDPNPSPPPKPPFSERIPPGDIEQTQPLTQQDPNDINENVAPQQDLAEQQSSTETFEGNNVANNEETNDFSTQSEDNTEEESMNGEQNDTNS